MNILIPTFLTRTSPSGVVTYYQTLARELRERGDSVQIVETTDTPLVWNKLLNYAGHVFKRLGRVSQVIWHESSYFARLYLGVRQWRHHSFDLIHAQDVRSGVAAWLALGRRVPVVLTAHYNDDPVTEWATGGPRSAGALPNWLLRGLTRWYRWLFARIDRYVFVSNYAYEQSKHLLSGDPRYIVLPNTVTINPKGWAVCTEGNSDPLIISNVGYIDARKNQELLIRTGHELRQQGLTDFRIWLIGDGPKRAEYTQLAARLGLNGQVRFWGRQAEPWRLVGQSDLYVHTALNDNCPYALLEAFAVGVPVLALPVGGIPELMPAGAGLLNSDDPAGVARQLLAYRDAPARQKLARQQTQYANDHLSHAKNIETLRQYYRQCIRKREERNEREEGVKQSLTKALLSPCFFFPLVSFLL